ncbi:FAD-binding protein [Campylobacter gastrosuis]|uniref:FAD-binding protein n=1 Tax=Campylobacter gastrosuis TaxID=2974576 RepID=A0ABT7HP44_9BACT|nr:FAD-binding protein [Campylobacter gastrosuis]MDL0088599.1 FAD-binding protein [Campylobacter gastrosuis]
MILPVGVSEKNFNEAVAKFEEAIGKEWVFKSNEDVRLYRDAYSAEWDEPSKPIPSLALAPKEVSQVQAIVRIANEYKIPLFPISTGKNLGYGGSAPNRRGDVIVDLKRMNRLMISEIFALLSPELPILSFMDTAKKMD